MYTQLRGNLPTTEPSTRGGRFRLHVSRTVLLLGLTSLFTDISSEAVNSVLPLYVVFGLGLSPLSFGVLDGLNQGISALVRLSSGVIADRSRRYKEIAVIGYGLSALCRPALLVAGASWTGLAAIIVVDRTGKGIRTAPRDAMISLSSARERLGVAFGVHRALDTFGALLGPVLAFFILSRAAGAYDAVFVVSVCAAVLGLGVLVLLVNPRQWVSDAAGSDARTRRASVRAVLTTPRLRPLLLAGSLLSLTTISDGFLYLHLQESLQLRAGFFPLLYVATSAVYFLLAVPAGYLADRLGRRWVYLGGYGALLAVYAVVLSVPLTGASAVAILMLFGAYYAATDGVLAALASSILPEAVRSSGLGALATAISLSQFACSVAVGALWTWQGPAFVFAVLAALLPLAVLAAWRLLPVRQES